MATPRVTRVLTNRIGVFHLAATGGVAAVVIFQICWLGTFLSFTSPTHAYIELFTMGNIRPEVALLEGSLWSLVFGGLSGALIAAIYNMLAGFRP